MMTLRQAHAQWCSVPGNTALGAKTRIAVQKVLLDVCGDMDVTLIDRHYIDLLLKDSKVTDQRFRANAISVLCHILNWLHDMVDSKTYPKPDFDFNIASSQQQATAYLAMAGPKYKYADVLSNFKSPLAWRQATNRIVNNFNL